MSLWFSGSAVVPALSREWNLSDGAASWLTLSVQLGFVAGTLLSALLNLPDIISPRHLFTLTAIAGAIFNGAFGLFAHDSSVAIPLRFLTGMFLAGVYPPAMKILATWFRHGRGLALGVLVGALTLGKAAPYLVNGIGSQNWRHNVMFVSLLAVVGGLVVLFFVGDGPYVLPSARFDWKQAGQVFSNRGLRLANLGLLLIVAAIWGASVVADSAQFSACVTELGDPQYIGTALTMQTCLGFLLTTISIELIPRFVNLVGWRYAFMILAPGPLFGVISMLRLRRLPEAVKIAHGRR